MNDPKLKLAMARLLPKKIVAYTGGDANTLHWINTDKLILETEWLYVMHLVEQTLDNIGDTSEPPELRETEMSQYIWALGSECQTQEEHYCATFNQRATAMCKVKGIEL
jgi:hypothetical protein